MRLGGILLFVYLFVCLYCLWSNGLANLSDDCNHETEHYAGLLKSHPWAAICLLVGIASLAGIPPFGGFIAKLMLFSVAFEAKLHFACCDGYWRVVHLLLLWMGS